MSFEPRGPTLPWKAMREAVVSGQSWGSEEKSPDASGRSSSAAPSTVSTAADSHAVQVAEARSPSCPHFSVMSAAHRTMQPSVASPTPRDTARQAKPQAEAHPQRSFTPALMGPPAPAGPPPIAGKKQISSRSTLPARVGLSTGSLHQYVGGAYPVVSMRPTLGNPPPPSPSASMSARAPRSFGGFSAVSGTRPGSWTPLPHRMMS
mmetsp:Transcript_120552/g.302997  ORF Transcript_120552/g.302997 Transcript_120552/m.302997 type:complete len:206 (+) Transcript_120552:2-619(+)